MVNMKAVLLVSALAAVFLAAVPAARADCCHTTGYNDKCDISLPQLQPMGCGDGSCPDPLFGFCGVGSCNIFGCNCDGGCRGGSGFAGGPGGRRLLQDSITCIPGCADCFCADATTNPPRTAETKDTIQKLFNLYSGNATGISLEHMQALFSRSASADDIEHNFLTLDKNGNNLIDPEEFDAKLL